MSTTPPPPLPLPEDGSLLGDDEQPLDPDLNEDLANSADADRRAATEGEIGEEDED